MNKRRDALVEKYATPFVQVVVEQGQQAEVFEILSQIESVCQETDLANFLSRIGLAKEEKMKCLQFFQPTGSRLVDNLLNLLIENCREELLYSLVMDSLGKLEKISNEFEVTVKSTQALSEKQKSRLFPVIEKTMGLKVRSLKEEVDPSLIGGFVITANNKMIDASIKHQLQTVKENLK